MNRKPTLVRTNIQRRTTPIPRRRRIVQPLIKKRPGLLPRTSVVMKPQPIDREHRRKLRRIATRIQRPSRRRSQLLQLPDLRIRPLNNRLRLQPLPNHLSQHRTNIILRRPLSQQLHNHQIVIPIHHNPRQTIRLREHQPASIVLHRLRRNLIPQRQRRNNPLPHLLQIRTPRQRSLSRHHPHRNLRRRTIKPRPQRNPAAIHHRNQRPTTQSPSPPPPAPATPHPTDTPKDAPPATDPPPAASPPPPAQTAEPQPPAAHALQLF